MFLRRYTRTKDGKTHTYYALVESVRTEAGPRQHVVAYLGELNHDQERRWQRTVVFHNRQGEDRQLRLFPDAEPVALPDDPDVVQVRLDSVGWTNPRRFGDVWLGLWLWKFLHLDEIVDRHVPQGKETVRPADIVAIEVINRLCAPCSEFALAEHWYRSTALEDLLGVPDSAVTKDRLYRTLDRLLEAQQAIEDDLKDRFGQLFQLDYDLLLYDLTSTYFEGLAEENDLARRGYSRDHRGDCKQIVLALIVTRDGFPLAHLTLAGNTARPSDRRDHRHDDRGPVRQIAAGLGHGPWHDQRGHAQVPGPIRPARICWPRGAASWPHSPSTCAGGWQRLPDNPDVEVKLLKRNRVHYLLARSRPRRQKERAIRRRQRRGLARALEKLKKRIEDGRLKSRDKILESVGRLKGRFPKARPFVTITVTKAKPARLSWSWLREKFRAALAGDGAYLLRSNQGGWSAREFWETYIQLTVVERAFRVLKSELLLRPVWHHYSGRTQAHVMVCVLAYALWKTLDHLAKRAGLETEIHKPDPQSRPSRAEAATDDARSHPPRVGSDRDR